MIVIFSTERQLQSSKSRGEDRILLDKSESWPVNHCTSHEIKKMVNLNFWNDMDNMNVGNNFNRKS